jgi:NRAMP (natural resistance-associated macrophage protein)-like metal ion transporter
VPVRAASATTFWRALGPGIVTGAADDDPSGVATYSMAGALFGTTMLWTALVTWPLMAAVQSMCARIGMVTGGGVAAALRYRFSRPVLVSMTAALLVANAFNIGADLAGMADALEMLTGASSHAWVAIIGVALGYATVQLHYGTLAAGLKWLALVLVVYVVAGLRLHPDWGRIAHDTLVPQVPSTRQGWAIVVAILGTTISPYLFFWQASQEVEEEKAMGRTTVRERIGATRDEVVHRKIDIAIGTFASNLVMFFILLTTGMTLHPLGRAVPETSADVARALEPVAGHFAALLYTIGIVGTGALAIPILAGSAAYAAAETFGWRQGIDARYSAARRFYLVITGSIGVGICLDLAGVPAVKAMYWSAVLNGVLAPFLLLGILLVASDSRVMRGQPSSGLGSAVVGVATIVMFLAAIAMVAI